MDIFAHGLWIGLIFRKTKNLFLPLFFGVAPDIFSFGIYLAAYLVIHGSLPFSQLNDHLQSKIPQYTDILYNITHSFIIFATVFLLVWFWRRKPFWPILAWGVHITIDIFSHSEEFFPTPFLFPASSYKVALISWGNPYFMILNYSVLAILYFSVFLLKNKHKRFVTYFKQKRKLLKR